jgi:hypothetical protein
MHHHTAYELMCNFIMKFDWGNMHQNICHQDHHSYQIIPQISCPHKPGTHTSYQLHPVPKDEKHLFSLHYTNRYLTVTFPLTNEAHL